MQARIEGLEGRMDRMDKRLENIEKDVADILVLANRNDESLNKINGTIKTHTKEIKILNSFKSGITYIGALVVLVMGYAVQFLTTK